MTLRDAELGREYHVCSVETKDEELNDFLFSLGCYSGEPVTVIARTWTGYVIAIKDGRYNIDRQLAAAILIE